MNNQPSQEFEKNFWKKFDQEFGRKTSPLKKILLIPSVALCSLVAIFIINQNKIPNYDPVAVQIAIEVDENLGQMLDQPSYLDDEWIDII